MRAVHIKKSVRLLNMPRSEETFLHHAAAYERAESEPDDMGCLWGTTCPQFYQHNDDGYGWYGQR